MSDKDRVRHSEAEDAEIVSGDAATAHREAANGVMQAERVRERVLDALDGRAFKLRLSTILDLNRCAIDGLNAHAGNFRPAGIGINESKHEPPGAHLVPDLVEELCDYVNDRWDEKSAIHLSSFIMWRLNWIHPFADGNGRTSRAVAYLVLCVKQGMLLPGHKTIPEQIVDRRTPYYEALEKADDRYKATEKFTDDIVAEMESLMGTMLAVQLKSAFDAAVGNES